MPKKTRKEKIQAMRRRQMRLNSPAVISEPSFEKPHEPVLTAKSTTTTLSKEEENIRNYFLSDLKKSLLIISAIFALEFFFYFATMNNYLSHYLKF